MFRVPPAPPPRQLYLVEADLGLFKVGCSRFPAQRADTIASHAPCRVRLVAVWPGEVLDEQRIHDRLEQFRSHHEWFRKEGAAAIFFATQFGKGMETVKGWSECDRPTMFLRRKVLSAAAKKKWTDPAYRASRSGAIDRPFTAHLLILARSYADFLGKPLSTVSSRVFDDGKKLDAIAAGADLYSSRLNRAIQWFSDNWPVDLDWPSEVQRPAPSLAEAS